MYNAYFQMMKLRVSLLAYNGQDVDNSNGGIERIAQKLINAVHQEVKYLTIDMEYTKDWNEAVAVELETETLSHFTVEEFAWIAADQYGDVIGGSYLGSISESILDTDVPVFMSDRTYTDEEEVEHVYTWAEYLTNTGDFTVDGVRYINASHKGKAFSFTEIKMLAGTGIFTIMLKTDWIAMRPVVDV